VSKDNRPWQKVVLAAIIALVFFCSSSSSVSAITVTGNWEHATGFTGNTTPTNPTNAYDGNDTTAATISNASGNFGYWTFAPFSIPSGATITKLEFKYVTNSSYFQAGCTQLTQFDNTALTLADAVSSLSSVDTAPYNNTTFTVSSSVNNAVWSSSNFTITDPTTWVFVRAIGGCTLSNPVRSYYEAWVRVTYDQNDFIYIGDLLSTGFSSLGDSIDNLLSSVIDFFLPPSSLDTTSFDTALDALNSKAPFVYVSTVFALDWSEPSGADDPTAWVIHYPTDNDGTQHYIDIDLTTDFHDELVIFRNLFLGLLGFIFIMYILHRARTLHK